MALDQNHAMQAIATAIHKAEQIEDGTAAVQERDQEIVLNESNTKTKESESVQPKTENESAMLFSGTQLQPADGDVKLKWKRGADLPVAMTVLQYVIIGSDLYIGGGNTCEPDEERQKVFKYVSNRDVWCSLPVTSHTQFGLGRIQDKPVVVGGYLASDDLLTGEVLIYEKDQQKWVSSIPPMPTRRIRACVVSHETGIVACGGMVYGPYAESCRSCNNVEMYQHTSKQWHTLTPLPEPRSGLRCTTIGDRTYFMGGFSPSMVSHNGKNDCFHANLFSTESNGKIKWERLADIPVRNSSPANLCGSVLAIGSEDIPSAVHLFEPNAKVWVRIGNLPEHCFSATTATLPTGEIVLVGGYEGDSERKASTHIGYLEKN